MKIKKWSLLMLCLLSMALPMSAQNKTKKTFTLEELIPGGKHYWDIQPKNIFTTWWGDKAVELTVDKVITLTDEKGSKETCTLFSLTQVNAALKGEKVRSLLYTKFPYAHKTLALLQSDKSTLLYDWHTHQIVWHIPLLQDVQAQDWESNSQTTAFVKNYNLYVLTAQGDTLQVTVDGQRALQYGLSVHRNEFGITKGTFWSPKGEALAFYRMDQSMVADYPQVDISQRIATELPDKYPMAGETSHKVTIGVYTPKTKRTIYLQVGDATDRYFTNIAWSPDAKTIYVIELPRSQDKAELVAYDALTGARQGVIYTETNDKYVHPQHPIVFLPWDTNKAVYQSEKDGYNHLYILDIKRGTFTQLTHGNFVVTDLLGFDTAHRSILYTSTESSPIQHNIYKVSVKNGKRTRLDNGEGVHHGTLSASGTFILDRFSSPQTAREIQILSTHRSKTTTLFRAIDPLVSYQMPEITAGLIKAADGKTDLYYRLLKPTNFDPNRRYPTIVYVYGGPGVRNVDASYNYATRGWEIYMAQLGYVVFVLDNRGSSERGFAFESATFCKLGQEEMKDQIAGVNFLKSLPYVDPNRLGVHGWSFGGFMTTSLMCNYPDVFKVGVAGGPVIDWKYYEVMYGERYMNTPQENPEGYKLSNVNLKAGQLRGRLQIILGYNDPVCVPQHSFSFIRACVDAGTQPDLFLYPGDEHNMFGRDRVHLHERITRYFEDYLK